MSSKELFGVKLVKGIGVSYPEQLYDILRQQILKGRWKVGDQLPSYNDLCKDSGLSRTPVQDVYRRLEKDGYIECIRQKGIFLKSTKTSSNQSIGSIVFAVNGSEGSYVVNTQTFGNWDLEKMVRDAKDHGFRAEVVQIPEPSGLSNVMSANFSADVFGVISLVPKTWIESSLGDRSIPVVYIGVEEPFSTPALNGDLYTTSYLLSKHFVTLNHKKIGLFVDNSIGKSQLTKVIGGHQQAMQDSGLSCNQKLIEWSSSIKSTSLKDIKPFFDEFKDITAVLCATGTTAEKILEVCEFMGLKIPEQLSLACCQATYIPNDHSKTFLGVVYSWDVIIERCFDILLNRNSEHNTEIQQLIYWPHVKTEDSPTVQYLKS